MTARRPHQPPKRRQLADLQCLYLRDGVAHVSPTATIQELLHSTPSPKEISLQQRIKNSADSFTDKHKTVMSTMREERLSQDANFDEAIHTLEAPTRPQTTSTDIMEKHAAKFGAIESQVFIGKEAAPSSIVSTALSYDYMSGVWRMLKSERETEEFMISPEGFEFDAEKTKWIPKSDAVVKQIEDSKQKCEEWLTKKCAVPTVEQKVKKPAGKCIPRVLPKIKKMCNKTT